MRKNGQKLLVIVGPTASGKSDLAVRLAKKLNGEIVSADSRQVYKGLDIGTGKITPREMRGIRHHLLDVADPRQTFSAERYRVLAQKAIADIASRGKLPILCGGSGFYIDAVLNENPFPNVPPDERLRKRLSNKSLAALLLILKKLDPKRAGVIAKSDSERHNRVRLIRAIEVASSRPKSPSRKEKAAQPELDPLFIGIRIDPEELKKRIRARLEKRLKQRMIAEARRLHDPSAGRSLSWKRMDRLGLEYRYLARCLQGKMGKEELVERLNAEIWHYARRQMTWFKRNKKIRWFGPDQRAKIERAAKDIWKIKTRGIGDAAR